MSTLDIVFSPASKREIKKLTVNDQKTVIKAIELLLRNPRPRGVEKVKGHPCFHRIKAGPDHRVIYHILNERLVVILVIRDRKDAYRGLDDLDQKLSTALLEMEEKVKTAAGN